MRTRKLYAVIAFDTTDQAMRAKTVLEGAQIQGRLIPLPPVIDAGCGLAWRSEIADKERAAEVLGADGCGYKSVNEVMLF